MYGLEISRHQYGFGVHNLQMNPLKKQAHQVVEKESSYTDKNPTYDCTNPEGIIQNKRAEGRRTRWKMKIINFYFIWLLCKIKLHCVAFPEHNILEVIGNSLCEAHTV